MDSSVDATLSTPGRALSDRVRTFFEPRFQADFSQIRVHSDPQAALSASRLGSYAYAVADHVVFGAGRYAPETAAGRALLAHELTHVLQQRHSAADGPLAVSRPGDEAEREADRVVLRVLGSGPVGPIKPRSPKLYRQTAPPAAPAAAPPATVRVVQLDNNVIAEVGKGNTDVAATLRALSKNAGVKVQVGRGVYNETTRVSTNVTANEVAARKAMLANLHMEVVDTTLAQRSALYDRYAQDPGNGFPRHGAPGTFKDERKTLDDLPHLATAKAGDAEFWTFDKLARENAIKLGVKVAPESNLPQVQHPSDYKNILKLVPEVTEADIIARGGSIRTPGGGGGGSVGPRIAVPAPSAKGTAPKTGAGAAPEVAEGPGSAPRIAAPVEPPLGIKAIGGIVLTAVVEALIIIGIQLLFEWLQQKVERSRLRDDLTHLRPEIMTRLEALSAKTVELMKAGPAYANITVDSEYSHGTGVYDGMVVEGTVYIGTTLVTVDVSSEKIEKSTVKTIPMGALGDLPHYISTYSSPMTVSAGGAGDMSAKVPDYRTIFGLTGDTEIRTWVFGHATEVLTSLPVSEKIRLIDRLLDGWVSAEDMQAIIKILGSVRDASESREIRTAIGPRETELDLGQRATLRVAEAKLP